MKAIRMLAAVAIWTTTAVLAAPPGTLDGLNIPDDFGAQNLAAVQRQYTNFGDYSVEPGGYLPGSEADALYLAKGNGKLWVGVTGNLETVGHAYVIGIGVPAQTGQNENRTEGVGGPPFTLQSAARAIEIDDNGTEGDTSDDTWSYSENGMIFPCETDFAFGIDTFGGTMFVSEYRLHDPNGAPVTTIDPTPDNPNDPVQNVYAERDYIGSTAINDGDDVFDDFLVVGYNRGGFDNLNIDGVTDTDGATALTATTGMEFGIPFSRLGLTGNENITVWMMLLDGGDGDPGENATGTATNQVLPGINDEGNPPCDPAGIIGLRQDMTLYMDCVDVNLATLATFTGAAEGAISASEYGNVVQAVQACPTSYGDQVFDNETLTRGGGSELDALYLTSDAVNLYIGMTGNLEENGNRLQFWIDSVDGGEAVLTWDGLAGGNGMEGDKLPPQPVNPATNDVFYDYAVSVNLSGNPPNTSIYTDLWDIQAQASTFKGRSDMESGSGEMDLAGGAVNQWNMQVALNNLNDLGVIGCGFFEDPCWFDTTNDVEEAAMTATSGFEIAVPLADLGLNPCDGPHDIFVWAHLGGSDLWRSYQSLPSARGEFADSVGRTAGNIVTDWYDPTFPLTEEAFAAVAALEVTTPGIENDCDSSGTEDVCDILDGLAEDCNGNGTPDLCDIDNGDSFDNNGDDIPDECQFLIIDAQSLLTHGGAGPGEVELAIDLDDMNGVEPRVGGIAKLAFTVGQDLDTQTVDCANVQIACANGPGVSCDSASAPDNRTIEIELAGSAGLSNCCTFTFAGTQSSVGDPLDSTYHVISLSGDLNGSGGVSGADPSLVKPHFGEIAGIDLDAPQWDYNRDGGVTGGDFSLIKPLLNTVAPACP